MISSGLVAVLNEPLSFLDLFKLDQGDNRDDREENRVNYRVGDSNTVWSILILASPCSSHDHPAWMGWTPETELASKRLSATVRMTEIMDSAEEVDDFSRASAVIGLEL